MQDLKSKTKVTAMRVTDVCFSVRSTHDDAHALVLAGGSIRPQPLRGFHTAKAGE